MKEFKGREKSSMPQFLKFPVETRQEFRNFWKQKMKSGIELRNGGKISFIALDSDGNVDSLIPVWLDADIDIIYPFEVQAGMDVVALRKGVGLIRRRWLYMRDGSQCSS